MALDSRAARKLHKSALISAKKFGFYEARFDIAQEVVSKIAEGKGKHQTVDQAVIDIIRKNYGRPGTPGFKRKHALQNASRHTGKEGSTKLRQEEGNEFHYLLQMLHGIERAVICLIFQWGFSVKEVAYVFGFSKSRASQVKKRATAKIRETLSLKD